MRRIISLLAVLLFAACASSSIKTYPRRTCVISRSQGKELMQTGTALAKREADDAELVKYDDSTAGDHGFQWIVPGGSRVIRPCKAAGDVLSAADGMGAIPWKE
jgi:hypothetical protein